MVSYWEVQVDYAHLNEKQVIISLCEVETIIEENVPFGIIINVIRNINFTIKAYLLLLHGRTILPKCSKIWLQLQI